MSDTPPTRPHRIAMHAADNVAIVANDGGLPAGTVFADGLTLRDKVPQGHKLSLVDIAQGAPVRRYNVVIGTALRDIPAGSWVHERLLQSIEELVGAAFGQARHRLTAPACATGAAQSAPGCDPRA